MECFLDLIKDFKDYLEFYPDEDEEHLGEVKGISANAPQKAKDAYKKWEKIQNDAMAKGFKL